mgnify:CR=1 FL=1
MLELLWNLGIFYTLHTLHYTRLANNFETQIRVSPEVWAELLAAYERLALFPAFSSQALRIFRLLVSNDVFQYAIYTGAPTLYRVMRIVQDQKVTPSSVTSTTSSKPSLAACLQTTKGLQQCLTMSTDLLLREISPVPPSNSVLLPSSSLGTERVLTSTSSSDRSSIKELGVVEDSALFDLFATSDEVSNSLSNEPSSLTSVAAAPSATAGNVMAALESLEASSKEIVNNVSAVSDTSSRSQGKTRNKQISRKKRTASDLGKPTKKSKRSKAPIPSKTVREESSQLSVASALVTSSASSYSVTGGDESRHGSGSNGSGYGIEDRGYNADDSSGCERSTEKVQEKESGGGSILDMLSQLENESHSILKVGGGTTGRDVSKQPTITHSSMSLSSEAALAEASLVPVSTTLETSVISSSSSSSSGKRRQKSRPKNGSVGSAVGGVDNDGIKDSNADVETDNENSGSSDRSIEKEKGEESGGGSILDMLSQLENDSHSILKQK